MSQISIVLNRMLEGQFKFSDEFKIYGKLRIAELHADFPEMKEFDFSIDMEDYDKVLMRSAPSLIRIIQHFGLKESGDASCCNLQIVEIDTFLLDFIDIKSDCGQEYLSFDIELYWKHLSKLKLHPSGVIANMNHFIARKSAVEEAVNALPKNVRKY
jgi:hypothetical protein